MNKAAWKRRFVIFTRLPRSIRRMRNNPLRLRHNSQTEVQSALRELERLESDHQRATPMHAEIELLGKCWLAVGHLTSEQLGRFRELVAHLVSMYRTHMNLRMLFCSRLPRASSPVQSNRRWHAKSQNDGRPQRSDRIGSPETLPEGAPVSPEVLVPHSVAHQKKIGL